MCYTERSTWSCNPDASQWGRSTLDTCAQIQRLSVCLHHPQQSPSNGGSSYHSYQLPHKWWASELASDIWNTTGLHSCTQLEMLSSILHFVEGLLWWPDDSDQWDTSPTQGWLPRHCQSFWTGTCYTRMGWLTWQWRCPLGSHTWTPDTRFSLCSWRSVSWGGLPNNHCRKHVDILPRRCMLILLNKEVIFLRLYNTVHNCTRYRLILYQTF